MFSDANKGFDTVSAYDVVTDARTYYRKAMEVFLLIHHGGPCGLDDRDFNAMMASINMK